MRTLLDQKSNHDNSPHPSQPHDTRLAIVYVVVGTQRRGGLGGQDRGYLLIIMHHPLSSTFVRALMFLGFCGRA